MKHTLLKYFGSKFTMKNRILPLIPDTKKFCSVFLGNGGVEFSVDPIGKSEVWNDIDGNLINLYQVIQNPATFSEFIKLCETTLFSEDVFESSKSTLDVSVEYFGESVNRAWNFYVRNRLSRGGFGKDFATPTNRLRRNMNENVSAWLSAVEGLPEFHERLKYVEIRRMDFRDFIVRYDVANGFLYLDPPYLSETRVAGEYDNEMSYKDHVDLLELLGSLKSRFLLHGYNSELYSDFARLHGWNEVEFEIKKSSSSQKDKPKAVEVVWTNYEH